METASGNSSGVSGKRLHEIIRSKKSKQNKKDPNAPKKAMTAYTIFSAAKRNGLKETQPELSFGELGAELGKQWRELSDEGKVQWHEEAATQKARYEKEMEGYTAPADPR
jgi:structure-specific recognition protein 1